MFVSKLFSQRVFRLCAALACLPVTSAAVASAQQPPVGSSGPPVEQTRAAAAREESKERFRSSRQGKEERKESRKGTKGLSRGQALRLARSKHPGAVEAPVYRPLDPSLRTGEVEYLSDRSARLTTPNGEKSVAYSTLPLRVKDRQGLLRPVDLSMEARGDGWATRNALIDVDVPRAATGRISIGVLGLRLGAEAAGGTGEVTDGKVFYGGDSVDTLLMPTPDGLESFHQIRTVDALADPIRLNFELPAGGRLQEGRVPDTGVEIRDGDEVIAHLSAPTAVDAQGRPVAMRYEIDGDAVVLRVADPGGDYALPVMVDPALYYNWNSGEPRRTDAAGWGEYQSAGGGRWCNGFYDWYLGRGFYTFSRVDATLPCAGNSYAYYQTFENNYTDEFVRGNESYVYATETYSHFDVGFGGVCRYSGIYAPNVGWQNFNGTVCSSEGWQYRATCVKTDCSPGNIAGPNYAVSGTQVNGSGPREVFTNHLNGATVYLHDDNDPEIAATSLLPSGWTRDFALGVRGVDRGLGMSNLQVSTTLTADAWRTEARTCSANPADHCPREIMMSKPTDVSPVMPEGEQDLTARGEDVLGRKQTVSLGNVKLDRTGPEVTLDGDLFYLANESLTGETYNLWIDAADGTPESPRSGVRSIEVFVDGVSQRNTGGYAEQLCPEASCELDLDWQFDRQNFSVGTHVIRVEVVDWAGNRRTETFSVNLSSARTSDPNQDEAVTSEGADPPGGSASRGAGPGCAGAFEGLAATDVDSVTHGLRGTEGYETTLRYSDGSYEVAYCDLNGKLVQRQHVAPIATPVGLRNLVVSDTKRFQGPEGEEERTNFLEFPNADNPIFAELWDQYGQDALAYVLAPTPNLIVPPLTIPTP